MRIEQEQQASQGEVHQGRILKLSYDIVEALTFIPNPQDELIQAKYNQAMFQNLKLELKSLDQEQLRKGLVKMRKIVSLSVMRKDADVQKYIIQVFMDQCLKLLIQGSQNLRYEACFILQYLAQEIVFCTTLISKNKYLEDFLTFLGQQVFVEIRTKASAVLTAIYYGFFVAGQKPSETQVQLVLQKLLERLQKTNKQFELGNIVWMISRIYKSKAGPKKLLLTVCKIFFESLDLKAFQHNQKDKVLLLSGLVAFLDFGMDLTSCVANEKIKNLLVNYAAQSEQNLSVPAVTILEGYRIFYRFINDAEQMQKFLQLALKLTDIKHKHQKNRPKICSILANLAEDNQRFILALLAKTEILNNLQKLLQKNDLEITFHICSLYKNIAVKLPEGSQGPFLYRIIQQKLLQVVVRFLKSKEQKEVEYIWMGVSTIEAVLELLKKIGATKIGQLIKGLKNLEIVHLLEQFCKYSNPQLTDLVKRVIDNFFTEKSQDKKQDEEDEQGKVGKKRLH